MAIFKTTNGMSLALYKYNCSKFMLKREELE